MQNLTMMLLNQMKAKNPQMFQRIETMMNNKENPQELLKQITGNYGAKEDGLKELEYMMHAAIKFIKMVKEEATSPEEQEIVRKHIAKLSV